MNLYAYAKNNPIDIEYRTNINAINNVNNINLQYKTLALIMNQTSANNSSLSLKSLAFSMGLSTPDNPKLPKWVKFSDFILMGI